VWVGHFTKPLKNNICLYRQSFMEWLNLEGIGDKKAIKIK
jgi:hypothetical protein